MKRIHAKRILKIALILTIAAMMTSVAWGQQRRNRGGNNYYNYNSEHRSQNHHYGEGSWWRTMRDDRHVYTQTDRPRTTVSGVPEPSAALLFATGGLIFAHTLRSNRKKRA